MRESHSSELFSIFARLTALHSSIAIWFPCSPTSFAAHVLFSASCSEALDGQVLISFDTLSLGRGDAFWG
jgi:hypothetical protein